MRAYTNRHHAGKILVEYLAKYIQSGNTIILAIPRGGVPVAYEVAQYFSLPLDVLIVQKLKIPGMRELSVGSIANNNCITFNEAIIHKLGIRKSIIDHIINTEHKELLRRESLYREAHPVCPLENKTVIIIDDNISTGSTMHTAVQYLKRKHIFLNIIIAAPIAKKAAYERLKLLVHDFVCPHMLTNNDRPELWYQDYSTVTELNIMALLKNLRQHAHLYSE